MNGHFNIEEYRTRFSHMTEDAKKELLIKFDRNLLEIESARQFLKEISSNDESFSVRYLAKKLYESKNTDSVLHAEPYPKNDGTEFKMASHLERERDRHINQTNQVETMFVHGKTIELDFDVKASQFGCHIDIRVFGFFLDVFLYLIAIAVYMQFQSHPREYWTAFMFISAGLLVKDILAGGKTGIGKKALGMEVICVKDNRNAGPLRLILRNLTLLGPIILVEALFLILFSSEGRRLGDYIAGTKVITKINQKLSTVGLVANYFSYFAFFMLVAGGIFYSFGALVNQGIISKNLIKEKHLMFYEISARISPEGKWLHGRPGNQNLMTIHYESMYDGITVTFSREYRPEICKLNVSDEEMLKQLKEGTKIFLLSMGTMKGELQGVTETLDGYKVYKVSFILGGVGADTCGDHYYLLMNSGFVYTLSLFRPNTEEFNRICSEFIQGISIQ